MSAGTALALAGGSVEDPPVVRGLAMPRGPVNGFAQAADFYDSVGICHHPEYLGGGALDTAVARMQELGLRHVRLGMYSPANHGAAAFQSDSGNMGLKLAAANASRASGIQPISVLWGTTEEPAYEQQRGSSVYTVERFLRPLDGAAGAVGVTRGVSPVDGVPDVLLENAGSYYGQGWETAGGLQGPNEPDNRGNQPPQVATFWNGPGSVRAILRALKDAKAARTDTVLAGESYVALDTGRITPGPARASQLPVVGPHLVGNNWGAMGGYTDGADVDVGNRHTYWGGHGPNFTELEGQWAGSASYIGLPRFCTESGYQNRPGWDAGPGAERYTPADVAGEYLIRTLIHNYLQNVRRTYLYKLCDESAAIGAPWNYGLSDVNFVRRAPFYAVKNLLALVGFRQGSVSTPITVGVSGFTPGADKVLADGYRMPDGLKWITLQASASEYLVILCRQRELWDRGSQSYLTVPDPQTLTLTLPSNVTAVAVAEPAKNQLDSPDDGLAYGNPTDGQAYAPLTIPSNRELPLTMAGLTRVARLTVA